MSKLRILSFWLVAMSGCMLLRAADSNSQPPKDTNPATTSSAGSSSAKLSDEKPAPAVSADPLYRLGPGDEIKVQQANAEDLDGKTARVDAQGFVNLPMAGKVQVGGLTAEEAQSAVAAKLSDLLLRPNPVISITEYRSQPVSVLGSVNTPGVIQLQGRKTLMEAISQAGGLRPDAGNEVEITRRIVNGHIPGGNERLDPSGEYSVAKIDLTQLMAGKTPQQNITVMPNDVISVPRTEVVYVAGNVHKPGGFPLGPDSKVSVLQAISLAEGLAPQSSPKNAKIFRPRGDGAEKQEIPVNVAGILSGKAPDIDLQPRDILFIPDSASKKAGVRAAEAALQAVVGVAIWRVP